MEQRRPSPLLYGAIALAVLAPLGLCAWLIRGAKRGEEQLPAERPTLITAPLAGRTINARPAAPLRLGGTMPALRPLAPAAAGLASDEGQMAAIDHSARAQAAAQAGLSSEEARRVEQIHLQSDRRREEIERRSEWASDEDLTALHDNAATERQALQDQLGEQRAQLLHSAEQDSYRQMLRERVSERSPLHRRLMMLRLSDGAASVLGAHPAGQPVEDGNE